MAETHKSFDEFYFLDSNCDLGVEVITNYKVDNGDINKFIDKMFCPECRQAKLAYVSETTKRVAHLRRVTTSKHKEKCSYIYQYATSKQVKRFIESLTSKQIDDKLNAMLNFLVVEKSEVRNKNEDVQMTEVIKENPMIMQDEKTKTSRTIRRKSLNVDFIGLDNNEIFIFYGKVKLEIETKIKKYEDENKPDFEYNNLCIYVKNTKSEWNLKARVYRGQIKDSICENTIYNIAIIGSVKFNKNVYIELTSKNAIKYCEK